MTIKKALAVLVPVAVVAALAPTPATAAPEQSVSFSPATAANLTTTEHCVTGALSAGDNGPAAVPIVFQVFQALSFSSFTTGTGVTDADGVATFCYTGPESSDHHVISGFADLNGNGSRDSGDPGTLESAEKFWVEGAIDYSPVTAVNLSTTEHCVDGTLYPFNNPFGFPHGDVPVGGYDIVFQVFSDPGFSLITEGTATTDATGTATFCYDGPEGAAHEMISGFGDLNGNGARDSGEPGTSQSAEKFWVEGAVDFAPVTAGNLAATEHCVDGTLHPHGNPFGFPDSDVPVGGYNIVFQITDTLGSILETGAATTNANGVATFCYDGPQSSRHDIISGFGDLNGNGDLDEGEPGTLQAGEKFWVEGSLDLTPENATNEVGTEHCLTGTLSASVPDGPDVPVGGYDTIYSVTSEGNPVTGGTRTTASDGTTTFCYTGPSTPRSDEIGAFMDVDGDGVHDNGEPSDTASKTWRVFVPPELSLTPATATNLVTTEHCVTATFIDPDSPIDDIAIVFHIADANGGSLVETGTATTDADGVATFCYQGPQFSRHDIISGFGDLNGDGGLDPGEPETNQSAEKFWLEAAIDFAPATAANLTSTEHCVDATLYPFNNPAGFPDGAPLGGYDIVFQIHDANGGSMVETGTATTDADGIATFCYQGPAFSRHDLIAGVGDLNGNGHHDPGEPGTNQSAEKFWLEAAIDFAPAAATNLIATEHCVTATLHPFNNPAGFPDEAPVGGYDIVIQGFAADASETVVSETVVTDSDGNATVCYDGPATSRHDIIAGIGDLNGDGHLDPGEPGTFQEAHKHWVEGILNLNPGDAVNFAGTEHCVTGEFVTTPSGDPALDVGGHDTVFTVTSGGDPITSGTRITAPDGTTAFCYTGPSGSRTDDISAFVDVNGDGDRDAPTEPASRVVHKTWVATQLDLDPPTATNTVGTEHCVTGTFNASVLPLAGYDTIYAVSSGGDPVTTGTQETLSDGTTTFCYTGPSSPRTDDITAFVDLDRNGVQNSAEPGASATKAWVAPNTPPVVGPITAPIDPVTVGTEIHASADFTDPDIGDVHTATWDWGDGTQSAGTVTEPTPLTDGHVTGSHTYTTPGIYTVTVTVDDGEATGSSVFRYVVIYDPNGGFVTGGGWIDSPAGSLAADPSKTGRANFGFSSKYKKGATVPTGVTEFQFKTGNLNFHSSTYEWLVVGGARAQYKGVGTINGSGSYGFKLTAIDGQLSGGGGFDKMRMKIWELATGQLVYDDQTGADDSSDASTPLGGGSIIIHKG